MKKSSRRKSNSAVDDDSDLDYEDIAPPHKKRASSGKRREKTIVATWKEEEEIEGFTISTLDSPNGSDSKEINNKHPRETEEEASEGIAALLGLASEEMLAKKPHKNIFTDPVYSSSESEAKSKESRKHRKALAPVTYTYVSSDEDYNSEVYEIEEEDIEDDLIIENDEAEYQPYSQRTMKKKEKEKVRTPKKMIKSKRNIKKRTHYPDESESSEFSPPQPSTVRNTVPINPPPIIPTHLPGTIPVSDNNISLLLNKESPKHLKSSNSSSRKKNSAFPNILPGSQNLGGVVSNRNVWRRGATHVAIAQYIYSQQRHEPLKSPVLSKVSSIDPTLESKIFKEHASSYAKASPPPQMRNNGRQLPVTNFPPPKFPPPPPFATAPNGKHFTNGFPGNPFPPFQAQGAPFPPPFPPQNPFPAQTFQQYPPYPGNAPGYHTPYPPFNPPPMLPQQQQPPDMPKNSIKMIPYNINTMKNKSSNSRKKDPISASNVASNLTLPPPLMPPPFQPRDNFTLRPLNLKR